MLPQWGNFQGFFWPCILHRVIASDTCWEAVLYCAVLIYIHVYTYTWTCIRIHVYMYSAICLYIKTRGMLTRTVWPFCLLKEVQLTLCIVQYVETTLHMFIPQINIEIFSFFCNTSDLLIWPPRKTHGSNPNKSDAFRVIIKTCNMVRRLMRQRLTTVSDWEKSSIYSV